MKRRSQEQSAGERLVGLDLVRGIAAVTVLVYHVDFMFGLRGALLPGGYLAVDLFFALSGFVIAKTYENAIVSARIGALDLAWRRLARLYPLFLLTTVVGVFVMVARFRANYGYFDEQRIAVSALANVALLPTPKPIYDSVVLFPFNPASWSIFYELVINAVFFAAFAGQRIAVLVGIWVASGACLIAVAVGYGGVDVGWGTPNFIAGFARVFFSFLSGMLVWRLSERRPTLFPAWPLVALIGLLVALMQAKHWMPSASSAAVDLAIDACLMPAIVLVGAGSALGPNLARLGRFLGDASYSIYLSQGSLIIAAAGFTQAIFRIKIYDLAPFAGFLFVGICIVASHLLFEWFEAPARGILQGLARGRARLAMTPREESGGAPPRR